LKGGFIDDKMQANQNSVVLTVVLCAVALLIAGILIAGNLKNSMVVDVPEVIVPTAAEIAALVNVPAAPPAAPPAADVDNEKLDKVCELTDGCDGWWDVDDSFLESKAFEVVFDELTEDNNKDLYNAIKGVVQIDDNDDVDDVDVYREGDVKVNQKRWEVMSDADDDTVLSVDMVLKVKFYEDGSSTLKTKYFRVQATLSDLKDSGITGNPDVEITSVSKVDKDFVLP